MKIDVIDPSFYGGDPYPAYRWLREEAPLYWCERASAWVVSRHADVTAISKDSELWSAEPSVLPDSDGAVSIACMDNPRHQGLRNLVNKGFTPRMVRKLETKVRSILDDLLDAIERKGSCDLVESVSLPLPMYIIAEMMGIPPSHYEQFHVWSDLLVGATTARNDPEVVARSTAAYVEYGTYLQSIFEDRRRNPQDDLVSILVGAQEQGVLSVDAESMDNDELVMFMTLLLVAGNETTRNAISGGVEAFIRNPEQRELLLGNPGLLPRAVEEVLRFVSPIVCFRRNATRDTELHGQAIQQGDKIIMLYQSANRDGEVYREPERFDITRDPNPHLAFGIGNHFCLGANLARMEIRCAIEQLMKRFPDMAFAPGTEPTRIGSTLVRGISRMPVTFSAVT